MVVFEREPFEACVAGDPLGIELVAKPDRWRLRCSLILEPPPDFGGGFLVQLGIWGLAWGWGFESEDDCKCPLGIQKKEPEETNNHYSLIAIGVLIKRGVGRGY